MRRIFETFIVCGIFVFLLCGCAKDPYLNMKTQVQESTVYNFDKKIIDTNPIVTIHNISKKYLIKIIIISVAIGIVIMMLFSEELLIQKRALFTFVIGIPVIVIAVYYLSAWLAGIFK